jgi:hypothetical protein
MPTASITESDRIKNPGYFGEAEAKTVVEATRLTTSTSLAKLAGELSEIAHRLFCQRSWPTPSPPGVCEAWTRDVKKNATALLANFGMDPGSRAVRPPADGVAVLFRFDQPLHIGSMIPENETEKRRFLKNIRKHLRESYKLWSKMKFVDPWASLNHKQLEYLSLNTGVRNIPPEVDITRVTLLGLAYIARHADFAQRYYAKRKRQPKPLSPEQIFFLNLRHVYKEAFGVRRSISTDPVPPYKRGGPRIRFCQAVAAQLLTYAALPGADPNSDSKLRQELKQWVHKPGAVGEWLRDAKATNPRTGTFRRKRPPKHAGSIEAGK